VVATKYERPVLPTARATPSVTSSVTTAVAPLCSRTYPASTSRSRLLTGTATAPAVTVPSHATG